MKHDDDLSVVVVGDSPVMRRVSASTDPGFLAVVELLRGADVAVGNLECNIQAGEDPPAYVAGTGRTCTYLASPPWGGEELRWIGFDMMWLANNHSPDFGPSGILTTIRHLDAAGVAHAGTGPTLTAATAPAYFETAKGVVALISASDWGPRNRGDLPFPWPFGVLAADPDGTFPGRPGVNLVRYDVETHVDAETVAALRRASERLGWEEAKANRNRGGSRSDPLLGTTVLNYEADGDDRFHFMGRCFVVSDKFTFETVPYEEDLERNAVWIREAKKNADIVVVGYHQQGAAPSESRPPNHTEVFAHRAVDAGADLFVAHGRGRVGAIEVYKGKPLVYGLPTFIDHLDALTRTPAEQKRRLGLDAHTTTYDFIEKRRQCEGAGAVGGGSFFDQSYRPGVIHEVVFDRSGEFKEVRLHPAVAHHPGVAQAEESKRDGPRIDEGLPRLLGPDDPALERTIAALTSRMESTGSAVEVRDGIVCVRGPEPSTIGAAR